MTAGRIVTVVRHKHKRKGKRTNKRLASCDPAHTATPAGQHIPPYYGVAHIWCACLGLSVCVYISGYIIIIYRTVDVITFQVLYPMSVYSTVLSPILLNYYMCCIAI